MTLRQRLVLHYGAVALMLLCLVAGLSYHEFATEQKLRQLVDPAQQAEMERRRQVDQIVYLVVPVLMVAGWWFTQRSLRPIADLAQAVKHVETHTLREPLARSFNGDEIDRLTESFNTMLARLGQSFQQIREFTLHASHELKTPLTVMRGELESLLKQGDALDPKHRESLLSLLDEVHRLTRIVDALTLLTKADAGQVALQREPVRLAELLRESFEDTIILAEPQGITVTLTECADITVRGDKDRLRQVLLNLADNAVKYNRPGGTVTMALRQEATTAVIEIINTGEGIPPDLQARVFDRFVRGQEAVKKAVEGCGLGLSIVQWIVQAHAGTIQISSALNQTTLVTIRLPIP